MPPKKKKSTKAATRAPASADGFNFEGLPPRWGEDERLFCKKLFKKKGAGAVNHARLQNSKDYKKETQAKCPLFARHVHKNFAQNIGRLSDDWVAEQEARGRRKDQGIESEDSSEDRRMCPWSTASS